MKDSELIKILENISHQLQTIIEKLAEINADTNIEKISQK